jgi:hypothetical protein
VGGSYDDFSSWKAVGFYCDFSKLGSSVHRLSKKIKNAILDGFTVLKNIMFRGGVI